MVAVAELAAQAIQQAWKRMLAREMVRKMLEYRAGTLLALRCWFVMKRWLRKVAANTMNQCVRAYLSRKRLNELR